MRHCLPSLVALLCLSCAGPSSNLRAVAGPCALIVTDDDITSGHASAGALYVGTDELGRRLLTADVVAVAQGFRDAGIACVEVVDSHDGAIAPGPLRAIDVPLMTPSNTPDWSWPFIGPMERPYVAAALIGFHSNAGQRGFRPHTINDSIRALRFGGGTVGEVSHLALGLGAFDVPVVLVSGDFNATDEARSMLPGVQTVALRWFDEAGEVAFLPADDAATALREAAVRGVAADLEPWKPGSLRIELSTWSTELLQDRAPLLADSWRSALAEHMDLDPDAPPVAGMPRADAFDPATVSGQRVVWQAEPLTAFVSIVHAASSLRGPSGAWELVSKGYQAWERGEHDAAVVAYEEALRSNPYDVATRCRMGQALEDGGRTDEALAAFAYGFARLDEVGDDAMKRWCALGYGRLAMAGGDRSGARRAALQLLALPESGTSRERALPWLAAAAVGPAMPDDDGLEGFFPIEAVDEAFLQGRGLPLDAAVVGERAARVGKLLVFHGHGMGTEAELAAQEAAYCALPHQRAFNEAKCGGLEQRVCTDGTCLYEDWGNCSGLLLQRGVFVTAAHCTDGLMRAPELLPWSKIVRFEHDGGGWTAIEHELGPISPLKAFMPGWLTSREGQVDVAVVRFEDEGEPLPPLEPAPVPGPGAVVWMAGFPRSTDRDEQASTPLGYGHVHGEPSLSFGRIRDDNPDDAPLCSTTGRQDDWTPQAPCPRATGVGDDGSEVPVGPITASPFLSSIDTINGYSGAPVFDAEGRWIGINSTVYGADPREGYVPAMQPVHIKAVEAMERLEIEEGR
jgi:D-aminopeptidase